MTRTQTMTGEEIYQYREWAEEHELPLFYQPWYLDTVCIDGRWEVVLDRHQESITAAWPYYIKKKYGLRYITQPDLTPYLGPYIHIPAQLQKQTSILSRHKKILQNLGNQLPSTTLLISHGHPSFEYWQGLHEQGYHQTTRYTYQVGLDQDIQMIKSHLDAKTRHQIKKAGELLTVRTSDDAVAMYQLFAKTFERQSKQAPFSKDFFSAYDTSLKIHKRRQIFTADHPQRGAMAMIYIVWDHQSAYLMMTARRANESTGAVSLLIWHAIQWAKESGRKIFDFEGSMIPSIERFFRSFGGSPVPYHRITKAPSKWHYALLQLINRV